MHCARPSKSNPFPKFWHAWRRQSCFKSNRSRYQICAMMSLAILSQAQLSSRPSQDEHFAWIVTEQWSACQILACQTWAIQIACGKERWHHMLLQKWQNETKLEHKRSNIFTLFCPKEIFSLVVTVNLKLVRMFWVCFHAYFGSCVLKLLKLFGFCGHFSKVPALFSLWGRLHLRRDNALLYLLCLILSVPPLGRMIVLWMPKSVTYMTQTGIRMMGTAAVSWRQLRGTGRGVLEYGCARLCRAELVLQRVW